MKKKIIILTVFLSLLLAGCKKAKIIFQSKYIKKSFFLIFEDTGDNEVRNFYYDGIKVLTQILNNKVKSEINLDEISNEDFNKYFIRFEYLGDFYILRIVDENHFILYYKNLVEHYKFPGVLTTIMGLDYHPVFDTINIVSVRMFNQKIRRDSEIPILKVAKLLDTLSITNDYLVKKSKFSETPEFIIRIQLDNFGYQLFLDKEKVWMSGAKGFYVFKSKAIKKVIEKIIKN